MNKATVNRAEASRLPYKKAVLGVGLAILVLCVGSYFLVQRLFPDWTIRGQFGDSFGAVNALFSGLAFLGVIYAVLLQRKELQLQREELELTRAELARAAQAQEESQKALVAQVDELEKQRRLGSQPWIFPQLTTTGGTPVEPYNLAFVNVGNGPAIDLTPLISGGKATSISRAWQVTGTLEGRLEYGPRWPVLKAGEAVPCPGTLGNPSNGAAGSIVVEYTDIYGDKFLSGWEYMIAKSDGDRLVLVAGSPIYPVKRFEGLQ